MVKFRGWNLKSNLLVLTILLFSFVGCTNSKGYIIIKNDSSSPITNVTVNYITPKVNHALGVINPKSVYKYPIDYNFNETAIDISYVDQNQKKIIKTAVGYSSSYDKRNFEIIIK